MSAIPRLPIVLGLLVFSVAPLQAQDGRDHIRSDPKAKGRSLPAQIPRPEIQITIVNATCVPSLSLGTADTNLPPAYPDFPQGTWTANSPVERTEIPFVITDLEGGMRLRKTLIFHPGSAQFVLLTGDLETRFPPNDLPQPGLPSHPGERFAPNFQIRTYPYEKENPAGCSYRIVNAMPSKVLTLRSPSGSRRPAKQLAILLPGASVLLSHQPRSVEWESEIDGIVRSFDIRQEGAGRNCLIPFFLKNGLPECIRVFQEP